MSKQKFSIGDKVQYKPDHIETLMNGIIVSVVPAKNSIDGYRRWYVYPSDNSWFGQLIFTDAPILCYPNEDKIYRLNYHSKKAS